MIKIFLQAFFIRRAYQWTNGRRLYNFLFGIHDIYNGLISVLSLGRIHCSTSMEYCFNESRREFLSKGVLQKEEDSEQ